MFDYKQRPWSRTITDVDYDLAVGKLRVNDPSKVFTHREQDGHCPECGLRRSHLHILEAPAR